MLTKVILLMALMKEIAKPIHDTDVESDSYDKLEDDTSDDQRTF